MQVQRGGGVMESSRSRIQKSGVFQGRDLIDLVFSWSLEDICNEELYADKVESIPESFESVAYYFGSYIFPLLEETRADLSSSMEGMSGAPFAEVVSMKAKHRESLMYDVKVSSWKNRYRDINTEPYKTLPGDVFVLTEAKPETIDDLQRAGRTWTLAVVTNITEDENDDGTCTNFRVKPSKEFQVKDTMQSSLYVVFLMNITTNKRIWKALHMFGNLKVIKEVLCCDVMVDGNCSLCSPWGQSCGIFTENNSGHLLSGLNESQAEAVLASLSKTQCTHKSSVGLIWGPPGTGKTKTVSTLLFTLLGLNVRTLVCTPTNVAITEVALRVLMLVKSAFAGSRTDDLFCPLGDILLFGNNDRLKVGSEIEEIFLEYRVTKLAECLGPLTGWRYCFTSMIDFFEGCVSQYHIFLENESIGEKECCDENVNNEEKDLSFIKFARRIFKSTVEPLRRCLLIFCTHIPKDYLLEFNYENMICLVDVLDEFETLLFQNNVDSEELMELFSFADQVEESCESLVGSDFLYIRRKCLSILVGLLGSLNKLELPRTCSRVSITKFCYRTASLIFCTSSSSYKLHSEVMEPLNLLVIDEAAQLKECESLIPLQLPGLRNVILLGDEHQLPAMVKSNVSRKAGFGRSLFERLSSLGHSKHLLNVQYRMHPLISFFPNSKFYLNQILDAASVKSRSYNKQYLPGPMFGPYSFINVFDGKEEMDDAGYSRKNMVEVAVVTKLVQNLHRAWSCSKQRLTVGVVSPYAAQVVAIQEKLGKKYDKLDSFSVKVKSIDGFQGGEEDVVIISTVRSNRAGSIGFITDPRRANVALTRARHCLWVLGNERTLSNSESIWRELVLDAKNRNCCFNVDEDKDMAKVILEVKKEFDQLDDLLNGQSIFFQKARWKVLFSDDFKKSFGKLTSVRTKTSVINLLLRLSSGWRPKRTKVDIISECSSQILKQFKVEGQYVVCSVDIKKEVKESSYIQVLKVWDILPLEDIPKLVKRLDSIFRRYTDDFITRCKEKHLEGDLEVPKTWVSSFDIVQFKTQSNSEVETDSCADFDGRSYIENSKVKESLLLMKFYSLSPCIVSHLLSDLDVRELDLPFDVTDQEMKIILHRHSTFVLGRSGTGKTTVLTMKLFQNEQMHHAAIEGSMGDGTNACFDVSGNKIKDVGETKEDVLRQLFVTVSPKLCYAVKQHVSHLKRFARDNKFSADSIAKDVDCIDDTTQLDDIPDSFNDIPLKFYPLVITFRKFLMMLDGTLGNSYFERFSDVRELCLGKSSSRSSVTIQTLIATREVNYERFCSSYWPHFNSQLSKQLDPSRVFTEIISHIKGGLRAGETDDGKLSREDYIHLSESRFSTLNKKKRDILYDIFQDYEKMKAKNGGFDLADLVIHLHSRLSHGKYKGDEIDFVYIDEVQDLTMTQVSLFKYICRNVDDGFVFSGDTAQTIASGIDFRFQDIKYLFYNDFVLKSRGSDANDRNQKGLLSPIFHLNQNFRTHDGVLKLAQSVIDLLYRFFRSSIDILDPETSLIYGEAPVLLESGNDENAIITIFRNSGKIGGSMAGFGAEQVILVRDDSARNDIVNFVGKQALILTIVECKGLEFQDVLLYNFFGSSPLKNQWRVIYEYMDEQGSLDSNSRTSFPRFNEAKHNILCSELKQLYVAITRTRQRLWICENIEEVSKPMFDYWKKSGLVQVRTLDESLAQAMQVASTKEEWKSRGIKLLEENNYEMATMCFERAGDPYWERLAKARGLEAAAFHLHGSNREMARAICREAAEIFEGISEAKSAARCYLQLNEFERAGRIYLEKCGESELDKAGECFSLAGCYDLAAEVYARGNFLSECLAVCSKGKLFDMGLQYIQYWKHVPTNCSTTKRNKDMETIEQKFLESCALHHHELNDKSAMMKFVKAFLSMEFMRAFLKALDCLEELLSLEEESGNFLEAAEIARLKGDFLLEANFLGKACHYKEAVELILWYVLPSSLWAPESKGWPLKQFTQKEQLLTMAKSFARSESEVYYDFVLREAKLLSADQISLSEVTDCLSLFQGNKCVGGEILCARRILDIHLHSSFTKYEIADELIADLRTYAEDKCSLNRICFESLVYFWNFWKEHLLKIIKYLKIEAQDSECIECKEYEDFCLNYLGVRKQDNNVRTIYVLHYSGANWMKEIDGRFLRRIGKLVTVDARHFASAAENYWSSEILSVGMRVVENLESLYKFSLKNPISLISQSILLLHIFDVSKFLTESKLFHETKTMRLQRFIALSTQHFFNNLFPPDLKNSTLAKNMISVRQTELSWDLLEEVIFEKKDSKSRISYGEIGRIVTIILGSGKLTDDMRRTIAERFKPKAPWMAFIEKVGQSKDASVIHRFYEALRDTFNANWMAEHDYISPPCFFYLLERLLVLSFSFRGYFFTTKSSLVEWLICRAWYTFPESADLALSLRGILDFLADVVQHLLFDKQALLLWIRNSNLNPSIIYPLLVMRLVAMLCLLCLESAKFRHTLTALLRRRDIISGLPQQFLSALREGRERDYLNAYVNVVGKAFKAIEDPLVIVSLVKNSHTFHCPDAIFVDMSANQSKEDVLEVLFPENIEASGDEASDRQRGTCVQFWETFGALNSLKSGSVDTVKSFKTDAPRIKVEVEKIMNIISAALTRSSQSPSGSESGRDFVVEANSVLNQLKQIASALNVSDLELENNIPKIQELFKTMQRRRAMMEPFLNQLLAENYATPDDETLVKGTGSCPQPDELDHHSAADENDSGKNIVDASPSSREELKNNSHKQENNNGRNTKSKKAKKKKGCKK